jgi:hypothetical protein
MGAAGVLVIRDPQRRALLRLQSWCTAHKLQVPCEEFCPKLKDRRWRFDIAWPDQKIALEVEGGAYTQGRHTRGKGFEEDCRKYNAAALDGWLVFRMTPGMLEAEWSEFAGSLKLALLLRTNQLEDRLSFMTLDWIEPRRPE